MDTIIFFFAVFALLGWLLVELDSSPAADPPSSSAAGSAPSPPDPTPSSPPPSRRVRCALSRSGSGPLPPPASSEGHRFLSSSARPFATSTPVVSGRYPLATGKYDTFLDVDREEAFGLMERVLDPVTGWRWRMCAPEVGAMRRAAAGLTPLPPSPLPSPVVRPVSPPLPAVLPSFLVPVPVPGPSLPSSGLASVAALLASLPPLSALLPPPPPPSLLAPPQPLGGQPLAAPIRSVSGPAFFAPPVVSAPPVFFAPPVVSAPVVIPMVPLPAFVQPPAAPVPAPVLAPVLAPVPASVSVSVPASVPASVQLPAALNPVPSQPPPALDFGFGAPPFSAPASTSRSAARSRPSGSRGRPRPAATQQPSPYDAALLAEKWTDCDTFADAADLFQHDGGTNDIPSYNQRYTLGSFEICMARSAEQHLCGVANLLRWQLESGLAQPDGGSLAFNGLIGALSGVDTLVVMFCADGRQAEFERGKFREWALGVNFLKRHVVEKHDGLLAQQVPPAKHQLLKDLVLRNEQHFSRFLG